MKEIILKDNEILNIEESSETINIVVEPNSHVTINERNLSNCNVNLYIKEDASCKYNSSYDLNTIVKRNIEIMKNAELYIESIYLNSVSDDTTIDVLGVHANVSYRNLCVSNNSIQTLNTTINHKASDSNSTINNIGVAIDNSKVLFNTIGFVKNTEARCDCRQLSKGIVLGKNSTITSKPILLIDEYDVKAYHGATIGKMSDDELFYLMSRGLSKKEAFMLMLDGLVKPFVDNISSNEIKDDINTKIYTMLG